MKVKITKEIRAVVLAGQIIDTTPAQASILLKMNACQIVEDEPIKKPTAKKKTTKKE